MMERQCEGEDVFFEHFGECCEGTRSHFSQKKTPFLVQNWLKKSGFETRFQIRYALMEQIALLRSNDVLST